MKKNKKNHVNGWLNREGIFHPCKFNEHSKKAIYLMKKYDLKNTPEYLGWAKIHCAGVWFYEADHYHGRQYVRVTKRQKNWLFKNDYDVDIFYPK